MGSIELLQLEMGLGRPTSKEEKAKERKGRVDVRKGRRRVIQVCRNTSFGISEVFLFLRLFFFIFSSSLSPSTL
jgi:hypothetical protein